MINSDVKINLNFTPNPNTLKYSLNRQLVVSGTENYTSKEEADKLYFCPEFETPQLRQYN